MADSIVQAFVEQYSDNVHHLSQQKGSKLRPYVREEALTGRSLYFERLGLATASLKTKRNAPTPLNDITHSRRRVQPADYEWAQPIDFQDKLRMLIDPEGDYVVAGVNAFGRAIDDVIIAAFDAVAQTGQSGTGTQAYDTSNDVAVGTTNLTVEKLRSAKLILDNADVPEEDRYMVVSPSGIIALTKETEVTSMDYNTQRVLVNGMVDSFFGFKFISSTRLPVASSVRTCFFWHRSAMGMVTPADVKVRIDERPDMSYATQVYISMSLGATRIEEALVGRVYIDETA